MFRAHLAWLCIAIANSSAANAVPVTIEYAGTVNFIQDWANPIVADGDLAVVRISIDDAVDPVSVYQDRQVQKIVYFPLSEFSIAFPDGEPENKLVFDEVTLGVRVLDYSSDLGVLLDGSGHKGGASMFLSEGLGHEERNHISSPDLTEALYLIDQNLREPAYFWTHFRNAEEGLGEGPCILEQTFGQCSISVSAPEGGRFLDGYVPKTPKSILAPVLAPIPIPSSLPLFASAVGLLLMRRWR